MGKRILETTLPNNYMDGEVLYGSELNKIVGVLRSGVNVNKEDIDKLLLGEESDFVFTTKDVADAYLLENTPETGQYALVMSGGEDGEKIDVYKFDGAIWELQVDEAFSIFNAYRVSKDFQGRLDGIDEALLDITNGVTAFKKVKYDVNSPAATLEIGETRWNAEAGTYETRLSTDVYLLHSQELLFKCQNTSGDNIANGTAVYISGASGSSSNFYVDKADNITPTKVTRMIGLATENLDENGFGYVCFSGVVNGINTASFNIGEMLYLSTGGTLTNVRPTGLVVEVGIVIRKHSNNGAVAISPRYYPRLDDLSNVNFSNSAEGDVAIRLANGTYANYNLTNKLNSIDAKDLEQDGRLTTNESDIANLESGTTVIPTYELKANKNVANGYVGLDTNNKIPLDYLYDVILGQLEYAGSFNPNSGYPTQTNALDPNRNIRKGDYFIANANGTISDVEYNTGDWAVRGASDWQKIDNTDAVASVNGKIGIVNLTGADIDVSGADTTTIADKITAIMTAINDRYTKSEVYNKTEVNNIIEQIKALYDLEESVLYNGDISAINVDYANITGTNFVIMEVETKYTLDEGVTFKKQLNTFTITTSTLTAAGYNQHFSIYNKDFPSAVFHWFELYNNAGYLDMLTYGGDISSIDAVNIKLTAYKMKSLTAENMSYDNSLSGLDAENVQEAIDELDEIDLYTRTQLETLFEEVFYNLFEGNYISGWSINTLSQDIKSAPDGRLAKIQIKPNTTYTVKKHDVSNRFRIAWSENEILTIPTLYDGLIYSSDSKTTHTFTSESNANWLYVYVSSSGEEPILKVEENDYASEYNEKYYVKKENFIIPVLDNFVEYDDNNMFDISMYNIGFGISSSLTINYIIPASGGVSVVFPCLPNTTYSVQKIEETNRFRIAFFETEPIMSTNTTFTREQIIVDEDDRVTFTTQNLENYFMVYVSGSNETPKLKVEEGEVNTPYAKYTLNNTYVEPQIMEKQIKRFMLEDGTFLENVEKFIDEYSQNTYFGDKKRYYLTESFKDVYISPTTVSTITASNHLDIYQEYDALVMAYPDFISMEVLGLDEDNNEIRAYKFSPPILKDYGNNVLKTPNQLKIALTSGVHGNEREKVSTVLRFFKEVYENPRGIDELDILKWNIGFEIVPIVSPNAYDLNTRLNINGVNINRNFDGNWAFIDVGNDYSGPSPASELETQVVQQWLDGLENIYWFMDCHNIGVTNGPMAYLDDEEGFTMINSVLRTMTRIWKERYSSTATTDAIYGYVGLSMPNGSIYRYVKSTLGYRRCLTIETCYDYAFAGTTTNDNEVKRISLEYFTNAIISIIKMK